MKCIVFYESWQINTPVDIGRINYWYENHDSDWQNLFVLKGKVETIKILYQQYEPAAYNPRLLVPVNGELVKAERAEGFDKKNNDMKASVFIDVMGLARNDYQYDVEVVTCGFQKNVIRAFGVLVMVDVLLEDICRARIMGILGITQGVK